MEGRSAETERAWREYALRRHARVLCDVHLKAACVLRGMFAAAAAAVAAAVASVCGPPRDVLLFVLRGDRHNRSRRAVRSHRYRRSGR